MSDSESIEKIAGIVGCDYKDNNLILAYGKWINPLLDTIRANGWCFDLMVEFKIELSPMSDGDWLATYANKYDVNGYVEHVLCHSYADKNPRKAVYTAIIAAHGG